jgi:hypothetical protein
MARLGIGNVLQSILDPHLSYVGMIYTSLAPSFVIKNRKRNKIIAGTNLKFLAMFSLLVCTKKNTVRSIYSV